MHGPEHFGSGSTTATATLFSDPPAPAATMPAADVDDAAATTPAQTVERELIDMLAGVVEAHQLFAERLGRLEQRIGRIENAMEVH